MSYIQFKAHGDELTEKLHKVIQEYLDPIRGDISGPKSEQYHDAVEWVRSNLISLLSKMYVLECSDLNEGESPAGIMAMYIDSLKQNAELAYKNAMKARDERLKNK
jgi:hypothetical protein